MSRCTSTCPHGDRCRLDAGHEAEYGHSHDDCPCNEPNVYVPASVYEKFDLLATWHQHEVTENLAFNVKVAGEISEARRQRNAAESRVALLEGLLGEAREAIHRGGHNDYGWLATYNANKPLLDRIDAALSSVSGLAEKEVGDGNG